MAEMKYTPAKYYVATYGNGGLEIEFYTDPLKYGRAVKDAKQRHESGGWDVDSYTHGKCEVFEGVL